MHLPIMKKFLVLSMAVVLCAGAAGQPDHRHAADESKYVRKANYELADRFSAKKVSRMVYSTRIYPNWFRDSDKFWYSWQDSGGTSYYIVDPADGSKKEIFDLDRLAMQLTEIVKDPFDAQHIPFEKLRLENDRTFTFDITGSRDKSEEADSTAGKKHGGKSKKEVFHFEYDIAGRTLKDVTAQKEDEEDRYPRWANVSPDGALGIFVKNCNLYVMDSVNLRKAAKDEKDSTIVERRLTDDGTKDFSWGGGNYSGDTEQDTTKRSFAGISWSPDSRHFAVDRWDMSGIKELWVINSLSQPRPKLETYHYQMPGEPGPKGYLYIFDAVEGSRRQIRIDAFKDQDFSIQDAPRTAADNYRDYFGTGWLGDEKGFYATRMSRDIHRVDICYIGVDSDSAKVVIPERMNTYVETRPLWLIKGGRQLIHWSERNGWANLYLYNADGTLVRNLTEGAFHVEDILAVNEAAGYILLSACGVNKDENPYQLHTFKVSLNGGPLQQLDMDDMDVLSYSSDDGKYFVANYSRVDAKPAVALFDARTGRKVRELEEADFSRLFAAGYKFPERFKVKAADGVTDLYGAMYKPFDFDSTKVYPICDYVYPGPQVEANNISWSSGMTRVDRLAQIGFIVITVGNRGGHPNRSKWYHNYGYGNLRDYGLEDQKYAIQQLAARYPFIDIDRVGIHGHSGGGFMSTAAILKYPDFFKVAVSCAGNHDNSIYNRWWSEQHHGILEKVSQADTSFVYHIDTNQELAGNLKGHLLLVHGDIDNNVHPANTIRVVNALIRAGKRFDFLYLPGQRHGFGDMNEYFFWKMADYYSEWLLGDSQRPLVDIYQLHND